MTSTPSTVQPVCASIRCGHPDCTRRRSVAIAHCTYCAREIGYQTPYVQSTPATLAHESCAARFAS